MTKSRGHKSAGQSTSREESVLLKKVQEKKKQQETLIPYIHKDCISNVLIWLPLDSLQQLRFVCKPWYNIVNSSIFVKTHLQRSESVLIFTTSAQRRNRFPFYSMSPDTPEKPNTISVEAKCLQTKSAPVFIHPNMDPTFKSYIQFLEFKDSMCSVREYSLTCLGSIRATFNGLILLDNKLKKGLIVINPVTRKVTSFPLGTLAPIHNESYGFVFCNVSGKYKVAHLFRDDLGFVGCEILTVGAGIWRAIDGPEFGLFAWFGYKPVSAIGALHWMPQVDRSDFIVSMEVEKEKFHTIPLPKSSRTRDGIVEMGGYLSFVTHEDSNKIDIWVLKGLIGEVWTKQHSIIVADDSMKNMVPLFSLRIKGDMIFRKGEEGPFYAYDFEEQAMRQIGMEKGCLVASSGSLFPHVNSMVSWERRWDLCEK